MKTRFNISILFLLFLIFSANAQELQELNDAIQKSKTNEQKFFALAELSDYWSYRDTTKAFETLRQALPLTVNNTYLQGVYHFYEAGIYFGYDKEKSQQLYMKADDYLKKHDTPESYRHRARLWHNYGVLEQMDNNSKEFLDVTLNYCIPFAEKSGDKDLLMGYFADVGIVFFNYREYDKALDYYLKAVSLVKTPEDETENLLWVYLNLFEVYFYQGNKEKAQRTLNYAETLLERFPTSKLTGVFYKNQAKFLNAEGKYNDALKSVEKGMNHALEYNLFHDYISLKYEKAQIYKLSGNLGNAKKEIEELLADSTNALTTQSRLGLMNELSDIEAYSGNYQSAYQLMRNYKILNDSVSAQNFKEQLADMETRYRTAEKEQAILVLENKNRIRNLLLGGSALLVLILSLWTWYAWSNRKKRNKKDILLMKQQREIEVSKALMDGEEQERKRLAQELHDGLVGGVTGIKINVERLVRNTKNEELRPVIEQLDKTITELRHTARNLAPASLLRMGLEAAINDFCVSIESEKTSIRRFLKGLNGITDKNIQTSVFRIVQELIANAIRHAEATEISLQCTFENSLLLIEVEDNGKGFDVTKTARNMGLNNIESRVKFLGGNVRIESQPGEGTHISIESKLPDA